MVTAAMVLKDAMKMLKDAKKKSYDQPRQHIKKHRLIGTTDAEAETPILWPPDAKN